MNSRSFFLATVLGLLTFIVGCSGPKLLEGSYVGKAIKPDWSKGYFVHYNGDPSVLTIAKSSKFKLTKGHKDGVVIAEGTFEVDGSYYVFYFEKVGGEPIKEPFSGTWCSFFSEKGKSIDFYDERYVLQEGPAGN